jgi:hypothetical protein
LRGGPAEAERDSPKAPPTARRESPIERSAPLARKERFAELRGIWQRPWADDDAADQRAFEAACREVTPDEVIEAAKTWVAAADAPRFLPPLAKWLNARGWEKPPPKKRSAANGHAKRSNGYAKPDMFKIALAAGGYREGPDGKMYWPGDANGDDDDAPLATSMWGGGR